MSNYSPNLEYHFYIYDAVLQYFYQIGWCHFTTKVVIPDFGTLWVKYLDTQ